MSNEVDNLKQSLATIKKKTETVHNAMLLVRMLTYTYEERRLTDLLIEQCRITLTLIAGYDEIISRSSNSD